MKSKGIGTLSAVTAAVVITAIVVGSGTWVAMRAPAPADPVDAIKGMSAGDEREAWIDISADIQETVSYNCCLEEPCYYCIWKDPGHGPEATCACEADVLAGEHSCGTCIGEILEGHGKPALAKYFAQAIAEEVGTEHLAELKEIIEHKYGIPVENQVG